MKNPLKAAHRAWQRDRQERQARKAEHDLANVEERAREAHKPPGRIPPNPGGGM